MKGIFIFALLFYSAGLSAKTDVVVGSKKFTESVIIGEILKLALEKEGVTVHHMAELGGTQILWSALTSGDVDIYSEYSSTIEKEIFKKEYKTRDELKSALRAKGIGVAEPLGFNNTYALGMRKDRAEELKIKNISDLRRHRNIRMGWGDEFARRSDGWPALKKRYQLPQAFSRSLDHDVAYRALQTGDIDIMDLYTTDPEIGYYDLLVLNDDLHFFPRYEALVLYRTETVQKIPKIKEVIDRLSGKITEDAMIAMNEEAKINHVSSTSIAAQFLNEKLNLHVQAQTITRTERILLRTKEHISLVGLSLLFAILFAVPLGLLAAKKKMAERLILGGAGIVQTIPSMALLVILIKPLHVFGLAGIGDTPALIALFLYSLLPVIRGTHSGILQIPKGLRETAAVLGLSYTTRLLRIELPLALPNILSGIKTAAVMNIGFATLGALVGAGGYGQPILAGIRLDDYSLILEGAIPSAVLALVAQQFFDFIEKYLVSPGLRK